MLSSLKNQKWKQIEWDGRDSTKQGNEVTYPTEKKNS